MNYHNSQLDEVDEEQENVAAKGPDDNEGDEFEQANGVIELTEEQLVELLQNADKLSPE